MRSASSHTIRIRNEFIIQKEFIHSPSGTQTVYGLSASTRRPPPPPSHSERHPPSQAASGSRRPILLVNVSLSVPPVPPTRSCANSPPASVRHVASSCEASCSDVCQCSSGSVNALNASVAGKCGKLRDTCVVSWRCCFRLSTRYGSSSATATCSASA